MGFHHVALATRDTAATHDFYTNVMGFHLVKVVAAPNPGDHGGWSKHFFYETGAAGGGMIAFWEIHDSTVREDYTVDLNLPAGLPGWVNHIAFDAATLAELNDHRERWQAHGHHVLEVDHGFCISIYIRDPSADMVEFCHTTRSFTDDEITDAQRLLSDPAPALDGHVPMTIVHKPSTVGADA